MNSPEYEHEYQPPIRPGFLTVLCILSFIGSGWGIVRGVWSYTTAEDASKMVKISMSTDSAAVNHADTALLKDSASTQRHRPNQMEVKLKTAFEKMLTKENIQHGALGSILASMFTLGGAILMWRLNRKGFYLYIIGVLIGIIVPFWLYGNNFLAIGLSSFGGFFGLVFIALYALNLSSMKK